MAGEAHSLAVTESGAVYSWGHGGFGRLGHGDTEACETGVPQFLPKRVEALQERVSSVAASWRHSLAVTASGALYSWGCGNYGQLGHGDERNQRLPKRVEVLQERVRSVAAGTVHSLAISESGALYSWGLGGSGQLGHGNEE